MYPNEAHTSLQWKQYNMSVWNLYEHGNRTSLWNLYEKSETELTASVLKKRSKTHKRLKERFLVRQNRTKRANFRCNHLFQATYNSSSFSKVGLNLGRIVYLPIFLASSITRFLLASSPPLLFLFFFYAF